MPGSYDNQKERLSLAGYPGDVVISVAESVFKKLAWYMHEQFWWNEKGCCAVLAQHVTCVKENWTEGKGTCAILHSTENN